MSTSPRQVEWKRLLTEGVVIVASILLAFAIDASWERRQDRQAEINQPHSIAAELRSNEGLIREKLDTLAVADAATREILSWMGPEPKSVKHEELGETFGKMYSIGSFLLQRGASERFLAGDIADVIEGNHVRASISSWYTLSDDLERQYSWLREAHAILRDYLLDAYPTLELDRSNPIMQDVPGSAFPFNVSNLLSDPEFESRLSQYLIRLRFVQSEAVELIEQ